MDNKADRNKKILAIVIVVCVLFLGIYKIFFEDKVYEEEKIDTKTISVLKDNSRFFTVSSCVSKYINYLSNSDTENLLTLLSSEYKKNNSIDSNNIYNYIGRLSGIQTFSAKKMFEQRMSKNIYKYYVSGFVQEELMNSISQKQVFYIIVILDEENMTFAIEPYDGSMFK